MDGSELVAQTRVLLADVDEPYLWTDDTILRYLREAESTFCQRTHALVIDTLTVTTTLNKSTVALPTRVLKVIGAAISGTPLKQLMGRAIDIYYETARDTPRAFSATLGNRVMTLYPTPDEPAPSTPYTINLVCAVMPEYPLETYTEPEIPAEYHDNLCDYAAYKCLITNDVDGTNIGTAQKFEQRWHEGLRDAKRMIYHYRMPPRLAMRNVTGGRNG